MIGPPPGVPITPIVRLCGACGLPVMLHRNGEAPAGCTGWQSEGASFGPWGDRERSALARSRATA